jgi:hypothetical protein
MVCITIHNIHWYSIYIIGQVSTLVGNNKTSGYVDGFGSDAQFTNILGLYVDQNSGFIFVADGDTIRKVSPEGNNSLNIIVKLNKII